MKHRWFIKCNAVQAGGFPPLSPAPQVVLSNEQQPRAEKGTLLDGQEPQQAPGFGAEALSWHQLSSQAALGFLLAVGLCPCEHGIVCSRCLP